MNNAQSFNGAMSRAGIEPPANIISDSKIHRFHVNGDNPSSLNGWYVLHDSTPAAGAFGDWKRGISETWCSKEYRSLTTAEKARLKATTEAIIKQRNAEQALVYADCRKASKQMWDRAKGVDPKHTYIIKKGINPKGIRQLNNLLLIPVKDYAGTPHGLQIIGPDGTKKFKTGTLKAGNFFILSGKTDKPILICEGYATGASLHEATSQSVIVAFDAGNLLPVAKVLKEKLPDRQLIICADNDHWTEGNPGITKATAAAKEIGALLATPVFKDTASKPTDFNDLHSAEGLAAVLNSIGAAAESEAETDIEPLERQGFPEIAFPLDILPEPFGRLTKEYARALQVRLEVMAMAFMTVISGAIGNSVVLRVKASWETAAFLWFAIIGTTGTGKSHAAEKIMKPVKYLQAKESKRHKELEKEYKKELANYKAKSGEYPQEPPAKRHYWTANFTIEALIPMYQADARGLIIYVDELAGLIKGLNQYKSSGNDKENLISLFNATDLKSDRKTGSGESNNSGAAVIGGIQPAIVNTVFRDADFNNGLIYRFIPMIVEPTPQKFSLDSINEASEETWAQAVNWMYAIPLGIDTESGKILPHTLTLDPEALEAWRVFHDRYSQSEMFVSLKFRGYLPKLRGYCLKFMAVLHIMEGYQKDTLSLIVSKDTVIAAIRLTDYFAGQALKLITGATEEKNPYHTTIIKALKLLHGEVTGGKILLNRVRVEVNKLLPVAMQVDSSSNKRLSTWLKEMGFSVEPGAGGYKYLIWDSELSSKISYEFSSLSSLSSLSSPALTGISEQSEQSEQFSGKIK